MSAFGVSLDTRPGGWVYLNIRGWQPLRNLGWGGWALLRPRFLLLAARDTWRRRNGGAR